MDNLETPYDVEAEFIECTVCDKSIRGETLYKIHLTTPGHIKKEDAIVASGLAVRQHTVPEFKDILQYLDYLKLDEPIIGLSFLEEVPSNDPQAGPRYLCRLCHLTGNLAEMVHHVIGRKHRQKYVELKRPDLVTWDKQSIITQGGKIIRTRAEIIERQDGRGNPLPLAKRGIEGNLNISRVPPRLKQNRYRNIAQSLTQQDAPSHLAELKDYEDEYSHQGRYPPVYPNTPQFHPNEPYMSRDRQMYRQEDSLRHDHTEEELHRGDNREKNMQIRGYMDPHSCRKYEEEYVQDPQGKAALEPGGVTRYDPRKEMPMPQGEAQHGEYYSKESPPYGRPYSERDPLKDLYSEEVRRGRVRSEYQPSKPLYPEDKHQLSLDQECDRYDRANRGTRQGLREPEAKRSSFPTSIEKGRSHDHLFNVIRDYQHKMREPHQGVALHNLEQSRTGPPSSQRRVEITRTMSGIPEPFRRFLTGAANDEEYGKRKRKSRFSDATAEELEMTKEMFSDECGPPNPKFNGCLRPVSVPLRAEIHETQYPDLYRESQSRHHTESYQRGGSGSEGVFDILKSIEIENAEEADFLKNKLCSLLKEFKSKRLEKAVQNSQSQADSDFRRPQNDYRQRGWEQYEYIPDERHNENSHPVRGEPGTSNRSRYEEVFGCPKTSRTPYAAHPDELVHYPGRFQEPMHPRNYQHAAEEYFDSCSSSTPLHMKQETGIHRAPLYSKNLDKITSTLLELVAKK